MFSDILFHLILAFNRSELICFDSTTPELLLYILFFKTLICLMMPAVITCVEGLCTMLFDLDSCPFHLEAKTFPL